MNDLVTYLNDHLAGSVGALEMLDNLIEIHDGKPLHLFLKELRNDIAADQDELKRLMLALNIDESTLRQAGAWVAEKLSRPKLRLGDGPAPNLALLQSLESLSLGIMGKRSLWRSLSAAADSSPRLHSVDLANLEKRAVDQFERVDEKKLKIAKEIFAGQLAK
jgi:hypothetical protein